MLAALVDAATGEPGDRFHAVAWLGRLIAALEKRRPTNDHRHELAWGGVMVAVSVGTAAATGLVVERVVRCLPPIVRLPALAAALQPAFALRGLTDAAESVRDALDSDLAEARERLIALVSRDRRLDEPHVVSAVVESLAENLTDSVTAPLLAYAIWGLPGAYAYRAVNTLDAVVGYHGDYEYVGRVAARLDDAANYVPARLTGLLLCLVAAPDRPDRRRAAAAELRRLCHPAPAFGQVADPHHRRDVGPNKLWTIAPMASVLGVELEKPGAYRLGVAERPLTRGVISEAVRAAWRVGAAGTAASVCAAALRAGVAGRCCVRGAADALGGRS